MHTLVEERRIPMMLTAAGMTPVDLLAGLVLALLCGRISAFSSGSNVRDLSSLSRHRSCSSYRTSSSSPPSPPPLPAPLITRLHANAHDIWWEERRARNRAAAQGRQQPVAPDGQQQQLASNLPFDQINLENILVEFAESDYMRTAFRYYGSRVLSRGKGSVFDVFQYAKVENEHAIILELRMPFDEGKKQYLDRLSKYIRASFGGGPDDPNGNRIMIYHINKDGRDIY